MTGPLGATIVGIVIVAALIVAAAGHGRRAPATAAVIATMAVSLGAQVIYDWEGLPVLVLSIAAGLGAFLALGGHRA